MRRSLASIGVAATLSGSALSGHTESPQPSASSDYQSAYTEAFENSCRVELRAKSIEKCVSSTPKETAAGYDVTPTCACAADKLLATKTVQELTAISREASSTARQAVVAQCLQTSPPVLTSK